MDHPAEQSFQEPTDKKTRAGYGKFLRPNTPYDNFMESQGIPIYRDIGVRRVQDLPRKPWKRMGGSGTFIQLLGTEGLWGCYVVEVPGAGALNPEKHLYEEQFSSSTAAARPKFGLTAIRRSSRLNGRKVRSSPFR